MSDQEESSVNHLSNSTEGSLEIPVCGRSMVMMCLNRPT